jgi:hypothetical protein
VVAAAVVLVLAILVAQVARVAAAQVHYMVLQHQQQEQ